jgi:large subunit ribosomal protein L18
MKRKSRNEKVRKRNARKIRVRKKMARSERTALTVYRSTKHIYAQLVDIQSGRTITTVSSCSKALVGDAAETGRVESAKRVGAAIAAAAREKQIEKVVFNRNGFLYHGRIKALAEAAREAGLNF